MNDITQLSACTLIKMIREKAVSAFEVSHAFIDRIQTVNPLINAIHQVDPERILDQARLADKAIANNQHLGKLHGLPISIKDTAGLIFLVAYIMQEALKLQEEQALVV